MSTKPTLVREHHPGPRESLRPYVLRRFVTRIASTAVPRSVRPDETNATDRTRGRREALVQRHTDREILILIGWEGLDAGQHAEVGGVR